MIYSIFAQRDATIYERQYTMNTGIDPLLELSHETPGSGSSIYNSRILLKFDVSDIQNKVNFWQKFFTLKVSFLKCERKPFKCVLW